MNIYKKDTYKKPSTNKICSRCCCVQFKIDKISKASINFIKNEIVSLGYSPSEKNLPICLDYGEAIFHGR